MYFALPTLILLVLFQAASAAGLRGVVYDAGSREPIIGANVRDSAGTALDETDESGSFELTDLVAGNHTFTVTHVTHHPREIEVIVEDGSVPSVAVYLKQKSILAEPVIVAAEHTHSRFEEIDEVTRTVKGRELQRELDLTLASTLKDEVGLAMRSMGPAPARPVIRGLGGDRVQITEDGFKNTDLSSTSPDHAVTIEPFALERIEVTRGPRALIKTPTTMGGVVNAVRHEIPMERLSRPSGQFGLYAESANSSGLGLVGIETPVGPLMAKAQFSRKSTSNLDTPIGELPNSHADNTDWNMAASYVHDRGLIGYSRHEFDLDYGIPGGFVGGHEGGVDIEMKKERDMYRSHYSPSGGHILNLKIDFTRVYYRHREFESAGLIGSEFKVVDYMADITVNYRDLLLFDDGTAGVSGELRDFDIGGYVFNPPTISRNLSAYFHGSFSRGNLGVEAAARYEYNEVDPAYDNPDSKIGAIRQREFNIFAFSTSAMIEIIPDLAVGINLNRSARAPTTEELFSEGPHLAAYSYEVGNPDLEAESGYGAELFAYHRSDMAMMTTNAFIYNLDSYIIPRNTGEINYATFLPVYASYGVDARLYGFEAQLEARIGRHIKLSGSSSYTRGEFSDSGTPLPQIPPLKGIIAVAFEDTRWGTGIESHLVAEQTRVDEFEEPTAGYATFSWYLQYAGYHFGLTHSISLSLDNLLATEYRNHLSRIKSIMPEAGRSLRLSYSALFEL